MGHGPEDPENALEVLTGLRVGRDFGRTLECPQVCQFAKNHLHLTGRFSARKQYWLMAAVDDPDTEEPSWWPRQALLHYAVLAMTNKARIAGSLARQETQRAFWQAALEGCKGSGLGAAINAAERKQWQQTPHNTHQ
jgi:hypothetical protein